MATVAPVSVFASNTDEVFATYETEIVFTAKILGGIPTDPKLIEGWLRAKAGIDDAAEVMAVMRRTLIERGIEVAANATYDEIVAASEQIAAERETTGFKRDEDGLYIEARQVKAMLKECVNINFAGEKWGRTKKGPKNFVAERVFVDPDHVHLGRDEADGIDMVIGHVTGPSGPRSTLGYHEYVERATLAFSVLVVDDCVTAEQWARIWTHAERNGLGALRSQGHGQFVVTRWERV
jgi:hypothetical protein